MYESFFGLTHAPFSVAPDPRFMYMSPKHRVAMTHLIYGVRRGAGFVLLTGEVGAGKTTAWRSFLKRLPNTFDIACVVNPRLEAHALLTRICEDLRVELPAADVDLIDALHGHLLLASARGRRTLIVVDEAQALSVHVLEQLRLLTNLDTTGGKLQVLLIGQPELGTMLRQPALEPLAQRVVARFHLPVLPEAETARYVVHRLSVAGLVGQMPFDDRALRLVHKLSGGVPRRINVLCDRALFLAYSDNSLLVNGDMIERAAIDSFGDAPEPNRPPAPLAQAYESEPSHFRRHWRAPALVAGVVLTAGALLGLTQWRTAASRAPADAIPSTLNAAVIRPKAPSQAALAVATPESGAAAMVPLSSPQVVIATAWAEESSAWRKLAMLWKVSLGTGEPCQAAMQVGLQCFRSNSGLALIRQLDRPGLLKLTDDQGHEVHVLLLGLGEDSATVQGSGGEQVVSLTELARLWRGEFATFWRPGAQHSQDVLDQSADISSQAGAEGQTARLRAFQLAKGLTPDGLAGPLTLMLLNRAGGVEEPRLQIKR